MRNPPGLPDFLAPIHSPPGEIQEYVRLQACAEYDIPVNILIDCDETRGGEPTGRAQTPYTITDGKRCAQSLMRSANAYYDEMLLLISIPNSNPGAPATEWLTDIDSYNTTGMCVAADFIFLDNLFKFKLVLEQFHHSKVPSESCSTPPAFSSRQRIIQPWTHTHTLEMHFHSPWKLCEMPNFIQTTWKLYFLSSPFFAAKMNGLI